LADVICELSSLDRDDTALFGRFQALLQLANQPLLRTAMGVRLDQLANDLLDAPTGSFGFPTQRLLRCVTDGDGKRLHALVLVRRVWSVKHTADYALQSAPLAMALRFCL
jgi:hypothetical protein